MKRTVAKLLFRVSGYLMKIKTPRRRYRIASWDPFTTEYIGRRWSPSRVGVKTLQLSTRLDWDHWDHWALQHTNCEPQPCLECGGEFCPQEW